LIEYLIRRGLEEYPESKDLIMLQMIFLRFVFRDKQSAMLKERAARMIGEELLLDLRYCLYAGCCLAFCRRDLTSIACEAPYTLIVLG
jgi:hypothetical protein